MRFAIDILHPRHVHFFRPFIAEMKRRGHAFLVTARDKDCTIDLLRAFAIPHLVLSRKPRGMARMSLELAARTLRFIRAARAFRPDHLLGFMGPTVALAGTVLRARSTVVYDNETSGLLNALVYRLCDTYLTPEAFEVEMGPKQRRF